MRYVCTLLAREPTTIYMGKVSLPKNMSEEDRLCVLAFDQIFLTEAFQYDASLDYVKKPSKRVQVVTARGLLKSWKQPVFYRFDCDMQCDILSHIIHALRAVGYNVIAMVTDMGSTNRSLWKALGVSHGK